MVNFLASVGGFNEEYYVYGYGFYQNGEANYLVSEDYHQLRQRYDESIWHQQLATPIKQIILVDSLLSGTKEERLFHLKLQLAKALYEAYPPSYFAEQHRLTASAGSNLAFDLLEKWRQEIDGYFEADDLQLFEEAVKLAYQKNGLDASHCHILRQWIKQTKQQMDDNTILKDHYNRTFWGFFLAEDENSRLICNASQEALYRQRTELEAKGHLLSPVFSKTYWYEKSDDLSFQRQRFETDWQARAKNCQFMPRICTILDLTRHFEMASYK